MDLPEKIKRLAVKAMFSDDLLMETLVLKGGNAIDLIYGAAGRASRDLDFSMEGAFLENEIAPLKSKIENLLLSTFAQEGLHVFDVSLSREPVELSPDLKDFWGGYHASFKVIERSGQLRFLGDVEQLRRRAIELSPRHDKTFGIDISCHEHCSPKRAFHLDNLRIYAYTPEMIVAEKLRAICQQTPEYSKIVRRSHEAPRARDFFDIALLTDRFQIDLASQENSELLRAVFAAKRVPLELLGHLQNLRDLHRHDFISVQETVRPDVTLHEFDHYFGVVLAHARRLESLWIVKPPLG
jgi:predicted nucleotidyltransferase component of viral defense system